MATFPPLQSSEFTSRAADGTPRRPLTTEEASRVTGALDAVRQADFPKTFDPAANPNQKLFHVSFDGTWNDRSKQVIDTNPAELELLVRDAIGTTGVSIYKTGVGSQGGIGGIYDGGPNAGTAAKAIVNEAYGQFRDQVVAWKQANPDTEVVVSLTGFSRGSAQALDFANKLQYEGVRDPANPDQYLIAPGAIKFGPMMLYDPVDQSFGALNVHVPPNATSVLILGAAKELRDAFPAADGIDLKNLGDPRITRIDLAEAHTGIGGGYDRGVGAYALQIGRDFLAKSGIPIAEVPPELAPGKEPLYVHDSSADAYNNKIWDTDANRRTIAVDNPPANPAALALYPPESKGIDPVTLQVKTLAELSHTDSHSSNAVNGSDLESDQHAEPTFGVADIPAPDLASHFSGGVRGGAYGAGQLGGLDVLPFNDTSSFLVNADGDMVGEINRLPNGWMQVKDIAGGSVYLNPQAAPGDPHAIVGAQQYHAMQAAQQLSDARAVQAAGALGLVNMVIGLQNWDQQSDLSHASTVIAIYNQMNALSEGALGSSTGLGSLGQLGAGLGFLASLESGNTGGMIVNGIGFADSIGMGASKAIAEAMGLTGNAANGVVPGLGFALALDSGDPVSIASSGMALMSSLGWIGPWGMVAGAVISVFGGLFGDDAPDIPTREGLAHAQWDAAGNTVVITDQDIEGGGPTATGWMTSLVDGLQAQLAGMRDANGNPYALVPDLLPAVGFRYDPDGLNLGNGARGFVYLQWTDENGQTQTRYYDGAGSRGDGTGETLAGDFMQHAAGAIAPAWQVQTVLAHYQQGQGIHLPSANAGLPQEAADGLHQTLQAITLALPQEPALQNALIDIDGDGYLERTQWLAANQQVLAIDVDGNQQIGVNELLSLDGPASRHSLNWLDADNDHVLNARDPAFAALLLWMDLHSDAGSRGETRTMAQAGIVAIDFGGNPPTIVHADGSRTSLTLQSLTSDVLGVKYEAVEGGVLQLDEQSIGPAVATLHAVNTRAFDGQADHMHGGELDTDGGSTGVDTVDAGDDRLVTASANTIATQVQWVQPAIHSTAAAAPASVSSASDALGLQQFGNGYAQGVGNLFNIVQRNIAYLPLHVGDESAVQVRLKRQLFLRPIPLLAKTHHVHGQHFTRRAALARGRLNRGGMRLDRAAGHGLLVFEPAALKAALFVSQFHAGSK